MNNNKNENEKNKNKVIITKYVKVYIFILYII